jgi:hypothetical protein
MFRGIAQVARRCAHGISEMHYAQRRAAVLLTAADKFMPERDKNKAPATYAEFLFRTSGALLREPTASHRAHGELVR